MSLVKRNTYWPFRVLDTLFEDVWDPFEFTLVKMPTIQYPKLDIKEDEKEYTATLEVPGYKKEDINIEVNDNILTISSTSKEEKEEEKEGYIHKERFESSFSRSFEVPENVTAEEIGAALNNGLLTLHIPKKELPPPKKIEIKVPEEPKKVEVKDSPMENKDEKKE